MSTVANADDLRMDAGALFGALVQRWLRIFFVTAVLLAALAVVLALIPKTYESSASMLVEPRDSIYTRAAGEVAPSTSSVDMEALMSSQIELIKSRDLLLDVIASERLADVPEFATAPFSPVGFLLQLLGRRGGTNSADEIVLANLVDHMTVIRERDSAVISVYVRSTDAALAARIANAIAAAHVKRRAQQSIADTTDATVWLQQEISLLRQKVEAAETRVANFRIANDLFVGPNATPVSDQQLSTVAQQIADAQQRKNTAQARAELIRSLVSAGQSLEGVSDVRDSVVIQRLLETKSNLQGELAQKSSTLLGNHPTIRALKAQLADIESQIAAEGRKVVSALEAEAKVEAGVEQKLRDDMTRAKLTASDATRGGVTLDGLEREAKAQRDLLETYLARYSDATSRSASNSALPDVRVVSQAAASVEPASPKVALILGAAAVVALALQIGAVLFGELMSGRALTPRQPWIEDDAVEAAGTRSGAPAAGQASAAGAVPVSAVSEMDRAAEAVVNGQLRMVLIAGIDGTADRIGTIARLLEATVAAELSAVTVDAGSGEAGDELGLTDLSLERAEYGDVVHGVGENFAQVPWGRNAALDRRSVRPMTLIEALGDIYHVVIVDTGTVGLQSNLTVFSGAQASVLLVASPGGSPVTAAAARRDVMSLGFDVAGIVGARVQRADVA